MDPVIRFENVSKSYRIGSGRGSLGEAIYSVPRRLLRRLPGRATGGGQSLFWALRNVSFEVEKGEVLGIIGPNGAGKTTILKLLSKVTKPTEGDISVGGRLSALIELGAGFHGDLTGRENVFLNGSILALPRKEVEAKYDSIVEFAGLADFMETPVKRYSSGMFARLGYSVAAHVDPDLLLVDEVLAVGDINFQRKCLDHMRGFCRSGRTVVFVSHNVAAVQQICDRVVWMESGRLREIGDSKLVVGRYLDAMAAVLAREGVPRVSGTHRWGSGEAVITGVKIVNANEEQADSMMAGSEFSIEVEYYASARILRPNLGVAILADGDVRVCTATSNICGCGPESIFGEGKFRCRFVSLPLVPGNYSVIAAIYDHEDVVAYDRWGYAAEFAVVGNSESFGGQRQTREHGVIYADVEWSY